MQSRNNGSFDFNGFLKSLAFTGVILLVIAGASLLLASDKPLCIELLDNVCHSE